MKSRSTTYAALVASLALLGGCGGSSSSDRPPFKQGFMSVTKGFQQTSHAIGVTVVQAPRHTNAELATEFHNLALRWQTQLNQLHMLSPPANVTPDFNTLNAAATRVESDLNAISSAAQTNNPSAARQASASLVTDISTSRTATDRIDSKLGIK